MRRLLSGSLAVLFGVLGIGTLAFASGRPPTVRATQATFVVGPSSTPGIRWTLNLWARGKLLGTASGTSGKLTVVVPPEGPCKFQADVLRDGKWYSGNNVSLMSCGQPPPATTTTSPPAPTTTTTTTSPATARKGGSKPRGGYAPSTGSHATTTSSKDGTGDAVQTTKTTRVSSSKLAFTGVGPGLSMLALAGSGLMVLGASLVMRRPKQTS